MWNSLISSGTTGNLSAMCRLRLIAVLMFVSTAMWIAFAKLAVPSVIKSVYRGESLSFLNRMIQGQHVNPIEYYLQKWDHFTITTLIILVAFWIVFLITSSPAFIARIVGEATAG